MSFIKFSDHMTGTRSLQVGGFNITLILVLMLLPTFVHAQIVEWAESAGGSAPLGDVGWDIAVDDAGNSYVTGSFVISATFGSFVLTTDGLNAGFIAKYDSSGTVLWAQPVGTPLTPSSSLCSSSYSIAVDTAGDSYIVGFYTGDVTIGPFTLSSIGCSDTFIAKIDSDGNVLWAQSASGIGCNFATGIALDESGNPHIVGRFANTMTIGSFVLTSSGSDDVYVAKLNSSGNVLWAQSFGGADLDRVSSIAVDNIGNSYITGQYLNTATFGSFLLTSAGGGDIFVAKLSSNGDVLWAQSAGGTAGFLDDWGNDIAVDLAGNSYVAGQYRNEATFGSFILTSVGPIGSLDIFVSKYDSNGNVLWAKSAGGSSGDSATGIAVDSNGNSYVAGSYGDIATFGAFELTSTGQEDIFVAKYNSSGKELWAQTAGGLMSDSALGIAVDSTNKCYVTGAYQDTATFGTIMLTSAGSSNIFVAKYEILPAPPTLAASPHSIPKQKYISIDASTNGSQLLAIKVNETTTGKIKWAGAPLDALDINARSVLVDAPVVIDWSSFNVVNMTGCFIQPFGEYEITFVDDPGGPAELSSVVHSATTACAWGDVQVFTFPPACDVGIGDIIEAININTLSLNALFPPPHGDVLGDVADGEFGIGDIIATINSATVAAGTPLGYTPLASCP